LYLAQGDTGKAKKYYEQTLSIDPNFAIAASNLAWIYAKENVNLDRALQLAQRGRRLLPQADSIADTLAWVDYKEGDYESALPILWDCVRKAPAVSLYHYHLGMVLVAVGKPEKGREELQTALRLKLLADDAKTAHQILAKLN